MFDAFRTVVRAGPIMVPLVGRPVLFALARALAEAWPEDAPRQTLVERAFRAHDADGSHRARLRVESGDCARNSSRVGGDRSRLRPASAVVTAVAVLAPPVEENHADVLALLADGEAWSSSALALALGVSPRTVQRALEALAETGKVERFGRGRSCRWMAPNVPSFPTSLLLPAPLAHG